MTEKKQSAKVVVLKSEKVLSKKFLISQETGQLKKVGGGNLIKGNFEVLEIPDPEALVALLKNLGASQATTYGLPINGGKKGAIACTGKANNGELTRTRENFAYPSGPAWMMFDVDIDDVSMDQVKSHFKKAIPGFENAPAVFKHSSSSFIYKEDECLIGEGGKRVYLLVEDGQDIGRAAKTIADRLKINGTLEYKVSKAGHLLERCFIDEAVYQPERLDFSGRCYCLKPIKQKRPEPEIQNNDADPFDTKSAVLDLDDGEQKLLEMMRSNEKEKVKDQVFEIRGRWIEERVNELEQKGDNGFTPQEKEVLRGQLRQAVQHKILPEDFILHPEKGSPVTVGEVLKDPENWHGKQFADPLEPDYKGDKRIATAYLLGEKRPSIWSFAHGGQRFWLNIERKDLKFKKGELPSLVKESTEILNSRGAAFQSGGELVRVAGGKKYPVAEAWLRNRLDTYIRFKKMKMTKDGPEYPTVDCPAELAMRIMAGAGEWPFNELDKIVNLPVMRKDGSILSNPGYDPSTNLILLNNASNFCWEGILDKPTGDEVKEALERIWQPYRLFPYKSPVDVGVFLAALLTVPVRAVLPKAPGVLFRAPVFGTGKTKLAEAIAQTTGKEHPVMTWPDKQEEQRKALVAELRKGQEVMIYDNIVGLWNSPDLAMMLTSEHITDRVLGKTQMIECNTSCVLFATGNNVIVGGDLARRIMVCDLDPQQERPDQRVFEFDPVDLVKQDVARIRADVLTVLRGYISAGRPRIIKSSFGSFEEWDALVRQAVCWIAENKLFPEEVGDPLESITANYQEDPNTNRLRAFMINYLVRFNDSYMTAADVVEAADFDYGDNDLYSILYDIAGQGRTVDKRRFGNWLSRNAGRIVDGMKIVKGRKRNGNQTWMVEKISPDGLEESSKKVPECDVGWEEEIVTAYEQANEDPLNQMWDLEVEETDNFSVT